LRNTDSALALNPDEGAKWSARHRTDPIFGYVTQGEVLFELEGQPRRVLKAGDVLFEPGGDVIHYLGANHLPDAQSQMVVTMFAPPGTPVLTVVSEEELRERRHLRFPSPDNHR
jgi:hypothetical protein